MTAISRAFALLASSLLLLSVLAFPVRAKTDVTPDDIVSDMEALIYSQDAETIRESLTPELDVRIGSLFTQYLGPTYTITSFDIYGYETTETADGAWHISGKYSIESRGSSGEWSASGLSMFIDAEKFDDTYVITDTDLHEAIAPMNLSSFVSAIGILGFVGFFVAVAFYIWMLVDVVKYQKEDRTLWILVVLLGSVLGALIYFFAERRKRVKETSPARLQQR